MMKFHIEGVEKEDLAFLGDGLKVINTKIPWYSEKSKGQIDLVFSEPFFPDDNFLAEKSRVKKAVQKLIKDLRKFQFDRD